MVRNLLIVDDEENFLKSLKEGLELYNNLFKIFTALNGRDAIKILEKHKIDLIITDLRMPQMNGFELLAYLSANGYGDIPVIVMTAYGNPQIEERLKKWDTFYYIEKPIDVDKLLEIIGEALSAGAQGYIKGVSLPAFLQLINMEQKTCIVKVRKDNFVGELIFYEGELWDAKIDGKTGREAALFIMAIDNPEIEIRNVSRMVTKRSINEDFQFLLMESARIKDENQRDEKILKPNKEVDMTINEKLKSLTEISGFAGAAVYTPSGETIGLLEGEVKGLKNIGVIANNVLAGVQKASQEMGLGRTPMLHIEAEKAHVLICFDENSKSQIRLVVVLKDDSGIGMAKMRMEKLIEELSDDFEA